MLRGSGMQERVGDGDETLSARPRAAEVRGLNRSLDRRDRRPPGRGNQVCSAWCCALLEHSHWTSLSHPLSVEGREQDKGDR